MFLTSLQIEEAHAMEGHKHTHTHTQTHTHAHTHTQEVKLDIYRNLYQYQRTRATEV